MRSAAAACGAAGFLLLVGTAKLPAQQQIARAVVDAATGTEVEVTSVFEHFPQYGFLPVRVRLDNGTDQDRVWRLSFRVQSESSHPGEVFTSTFQAGAEKKSEAFHEALVPVPTLLGTYHGYGSRALDVTISSSGLDTQTSWASGKASPSWPFIGVSAKIATPNIEALDQEAQKSVSRSGTSVQVFGSRFDPEHLPSDWRGLSGVHILMITDDEWLALSPAARTAALDWLRFGGTLHIYSNKDYLTLESLGVVSEGEAGASKKSGDIGLGEVAVISWNGKDLEASETVSRYDRIASAIDVADRFELDYSGSSWGLQDKLGTRSFGTWQIAVILIAFGILVGPVNLFVFAPPGRRHRLFVTTPIISLGTSLLLVMLILFQDGTGGDGLRFAFVQIDPGQRKAYLQQEQISRTGVLFSNGFDVDSPLFITPVATRPSDWALISRGGGRDDRAYSMRGLIYDGDFFQSRSEQGQFLASVVATRGRVEYIGRGESGPIILSSLEFPVDRIVFTDDAGLVYASAGPVASGEKIELQPSNEDPMDIVRDVAALASPSAREAIDEVADEPGTFLACVRGENHPLMIDTLGAIDWDKDAILLHGPIVAAP